MQKRFFMLLLIFQLVTIAKLFSQNIALNATGILPDTSAMLDVSSTNKGFLMPRMTTSQMNAIPLPATGLIIFNTNINMFEVNAGTPASPSWQALGTTVGNWLTGGNSGLNSGQKFIGTTDSVSLRFRTNNTQRMVLDSLGNVGIGSSPSFTASPNADKFLVDAGATTSYNVITAKGNVNNYLQFNVQNQSSGASASSDLVATADNGSETTNYVDMGVNGSGYTGGVMGSPDDAYLFNIGNNFLVGTGSSSKAIVFMTGGTSQAANERMRIDGTGKVGIGTTSPGSTLDVKGTLHLSGSTSGYVGIAPPAAAGSTTYTLPAADGTSGQVLSTNGSGILSWATASSGSTTHTLSSSSNTITSTVNGVTGTASAVNTVANTSSTNTLTTTVNGVAATGVNIINSNTLSLSSGNLTSTVNGVASSPVSLSSLDSSIYKMDGTLWGARNVTMGANNLTFGATTGNLIFNPSSTGKVGIGTTSPASSLDVKGTLHLSGSTSGYVGFAPAAAAGSTTYTLPIADGASGQMLSTNGSGTLAWATPSSSTTHTLSSSGNIVTSTVNGVTGTASAVNTVANSSSTNTLTTTVNGVAATSVNIINSNALSLSSGNLTSTVNGVTSTPVSLSSLDSSIYKMDGTLWANRTVTMGADNLTFGSTTGNLIFNPSSTGKVGIGTTTPGSSLDVKGTLHLSGSTSGYVGFVPAAAAGSTTYTLPTGDGASGQQLTTNGSGVLSWVAASGSTTNVISSSGNIVTSTVNGITDTATTVNTIANTSSANTLTTTVNGVAATGVNIINSNALSLSSGNLTSTVNGVTSTPVSLSSLDSSIYKMDGTLWANRTVTMGADNLTFGSTTGNLLFNPSSTGKVGIGTTSPASTLDVKGTLHLSGSTSGYVGFVPAAAAGSTTYTLPTGDGAGGQMLSTNGSGTLAWATPTVATTHTLSSSGNTVTSTVNGVTGTASAVNTVANNSSTNTLTTTVNGVAATGVNIINSNALSLSSGNLTSTVNGVVSSPVSLSSLDSNIYKMDGTLWASRTVTMGADNLTFGSTTGNLIFNPSSTGKVGIGTTAPGSSLDVKGTLHLSGSTSGYVGFAPAAAAGSTTYTLPSSDGASGQQLTTNGSGVLSWVAAGGNTTNALSSSGNILTSTVNGITDTATAVNTVANTSSANTLTTSVNGVTGGTVNLINSNALSLSGGDLTSTVNGIASSAVVLPVSSADNGLTVSSNNIQLGGNLIQATTVTNNGNALNIAGSAISSTFASTGYLGIGTASPAKALHVVMNSSGTNVATFENSNAAGFSSTDYLDNTGALSSTYGYANTSSGGIFSGRSYMNSYGHDYVLTSNSTLYNIFIQGTTGNVGINNSAPGSTLDVKGTLRLSGSTSGYVGFTPAAAAGSTTYTLPSADGTSGQQLTTNGSGTLSWASPAAISSVSNTSSANSLTTTVSGVTGSAVNIINTNALSLSGTSITSTVNGVASSPLDISSVSSNLYNTDGTLSSARTVTMGANNLTFNSTTGNFIINPSSTGNVGIGTTTPKSILDVDGAFGTTLSVESGSAAVTLDNTAGVWYFTGSSSVTLPTPSTCTNRRYTVVNRSGSARSISSFTNLSGLATTSMAANSSIEIISTGVSWYQIR
jgi:trimeric autotransporter adhesin